MAFQPGKIGLIEIEPELSSGSWVEDAVPNLAGTVNHIQLSQVRPPLVDVTRLNAEYFEGAVNPIRNRLLVRGLLDDAQNPGALNRRPVMLTFYPTSVATKYRRFTAWCVRLDIIEPSDGPGQYEALFEGDGNFNDLLTWS